MNRRQTAASVGLASLLLATTIRVQAATPVRLTGSIGGEVKSASGIAQMGATVILYNRYDRVLRQVLTSPDGRFAFDALLPDSYSVRVSLSTFIPAFRRNVAVQPGFHSVLTINLSSVLSSIEFVHAVPSTSSLMSDDWKWVLRSAQTTRPVMRVLPGLQAPRPAMVNAFSETRGVLRVSAGDADGSPATGPQPDIGTAFALATSLFGTNQLEFAGNFGYSSRTGLPAAGFRTRYSRVGTPSRTPEITLSMYQVYLPARGGFGSALAGGPSLKSMSATVLDELELADGIRLEYGSSLESVSLLNRLNRVSPFARMTYDLDGLGVLQLAYSSGVAATALASRHVRDAGREESALALVTQNSAPRVTIRDGAAHVQRNQNFELGYTKVAGTRIYSAGLFHEAIADQALMLAGAGSLFDGDLLPDLGSESAIFNAGRFHRWGYNASLTQSFGKRLEASAAVGRGGALTSIVNELGAADAASLRRLLRVEDRNWAQGRLAGTVPLSGTRVVASYGWTSGRSLMPLHLYLAQRLNSEPGLNITLRQPLPSVGMPGRFEANAELRNLFEQGYLPVVVAGRPLVFTNAPRALRGGLSFIF